MKTTIKKLLATAVAAVMSVSMLGMSALAEEDGVINYIDENGAEATITQAELDAGHWNADALDGVLPMLYENFPMSVDPFVNDYAELSLRLDYKKKLADGDSASLVIYNITDDKEFASYDSIFRGVVSEQLEIDKDYALILTETIDGVTTEYYKAVRTSNEQAKMPEYISEGTTDDSDVVLVGDIEDLRASVHEDEDGEMIIDGTMPRYTQVRANEFAEYKNNLAPNAIYRLYATEGSKRYTGYVSTYENGGELGIYNPAADVMSWEDYTSPSTIAANAETPKFTAAAVKSASKLDMSHFRDRPYSLRPGRDPELRVYAMRVKEYALLNHDVYVMSGHFTSKVCCEVWHSTSLTATPTYKGTFFPGSADHFDIEFVTSIAGNVKPDEYIYFVFSNATTEYSYGMINLTCKDNTYHSDDVTGSFEEAYNGKSIFNVGDYIENYLHDEYDVDAYFLNYKDTAQQKFYAAIHNYSPKVDMTMEISFYKNQTSYFYVDPSPADAVTAYIYMPHGGDQAGVPGGIADDGNYRYVCSSSSYKFYADKNNQAFMSVFSSASNYYSTGYRAKYELEAGKSKS